MVVVGVAAHIAAASEKGPRFDRQMTSEQRRHQSNGVWMCTIHGKAADDDASTFSVDDLRKWKLAAEKASLPNVWTGEVLQGLVEPDEDSPEADELHRLGLPLGTDISVVTRRARAAAAVDLATFTIGPSWPTEPVLLDLTFEAGNERKLFAAEGLAAAAAVYQAIIVSAPPGVGKTTTLLQAASTMLGQSGFIPLFVPLPEWSAQAHDCLTYAADRPAFAEVTVADFRLLASFGRLVLFLDGWNELDTTSRAAVAAQLQALNRQFPEMGIVLSTRRQAMDMPVEGPVVSVEPLTEDQQLQIARKAEGGAERLDQAWRTPGVSDLVSIPLYLDALLGGAVTEPIPTTKEAILRLFVEQHRRAWRRREALNEAFSGQEDVFLEALAVSATYAANTAIQTQTARTVVSETARQLTADGQFILQTQPATLLNVLVSEHSLISAGTAGFAFQHQQFQEWYASFEVERTMASAHVGEAEARTRLRETILNWPVWEEATLFAIERLSRRDDEAAIAAAAEAIEQALEVDPLLAAEMSFRSTQAVWDRVKAKMMALASRWHAPGDVDRAVRFMITTGKPEFSEVIWGLIEQDTGQRYISVFDVARRFKGGVLAPTHRANISDLPPEKRKHVLSELAQHGDLDAINLATDLAQTDSADDVKLATLRALLFRRADRQAMALLKPASEAVWEDLAASGWISEVFDQRARDRLTTIRLRQTQLDPTGRARLAMISSLPKDPALGMEAREILASPEFPASDPDVGMVVSHLHEQYPEDVVQALVSRLLGGLRLPFAGHDMVRESGLLVDDGPVVELVMTPGPTHGPANTAAAIVGSKTIGRLLDLQLEYNAAWLPAGPQERTALHEAYGWVAFRLHSAPLKAFVEAVLARPSTTDLDEIAGLADLIASHGSGGEPKPLPLGGPLRAQLVARLGEWAQVYVDQAASVSRSQRSRIVRAIGRVPDTRFIPLLAELLEQEIVQRRAAKAARAARPFSPPADDGTMWYFHDFRRTFAAISGEASKAVLLPKLVDPDFGVEAAQALRTIADIEAHGPSESGDGATAPTFADVEARRLQRERGEEPAPSPIAAAILTVVSDIMDSSADELGRGRGLALAAVAFQLPHEPNDDLVQALLAAPGNTGGKLHLLTVRTLVGHRLSAAAVMAGLAELLEIGKRETWRLSLDNGEVIRWLSLLPMSDRPAAILDGLTMVEHLRPRVWQLRPIVSALAANSSASAEEVLLSLPDRDAEFAKDHDWRAAVERRGSVSAIRALLALEEAGGIGFAGRDLAASAASVMAANDDFRDELYERYRVLPWGRAATTLASVMAERPDERAITMLIEGYAKRGPYFDGMIERAIENLALGRRASADWAGAIELFSAPISNLRRMLLAMTVKTDPEAALARVALTVIDSLRDRHGQVETEPRHPDLESGIPWPV